jgi:hypothetical protein
LQEWKASTLTVLQGLLHTMRTVQVLDMARDSLFMHACLSTYTQTLSACWPSAQQLPNPSQMRIVKEDGIAGLFRGGGPTVVRAMALNMGMLASNDQAKEMLQAAGFQGQTAVLGGAMIAGAGCFVL